MSNVYADLGGVDFGKERDVVSVYKALCRATRGNVSDLEAYGFGVPEDVGLFSDGFDLDVGRLYREIGDRKIRIVMGADGPGTKPMAHLLYMGTKGSESSTVAQISRDSVGICSVAMTANDQIASGARPAWMCDYFSWQHPNVDIARDIAHGLAEGAKQAGAAFIGGENASLAEMIRGYDGCAFGVGVVLNERYTGNALSGKKVEAGDVIIGIGSSGLHCNGISLARKSLVYFPLLGWEGAYKIDEIVPDFGHTALEEILTPTIIYKGPVLDGVLEDDKIDVKAIVNITGEGILNLHRVLPKGKGAVINTRESKLQPQPVFSIIQKQADVSDQEMWTDFNMSIGMYVIVPKDQADLTIGRLEQYDVGGVPIKASVIGEITENDDHVIGLITPKFNHSYKPEV